MARLNSIIKLFFVLGQMIFLFASIICFVFAAVVFSGRLPAFNFPLARHISTMVLLISGAALVFSCFGCCAVFRQTTRSGCFSGRRMLFIHLLLLVALLGFGIVQMRFLQTQESRIAAIMDDQESFQEYNAFERHVAKFVNNLYFSASIESDWLTFLVENKCPKRMSLERCSLEQGPDCDISDKLCCPNESLCGSDFKSACPYENCRVEILGELYELVVPLRIGAALVCSIASLMLGLSCLLICYNKRDEIEVELLKSGNISEEDIDAIRRLKSNHANKQAEVGFEQSHGGPRLRPNRMKVSPHQLA